LGTTSRPAESMVVFMPLNYHKMAYLSKSSTASIAR